MLVMPVVHVPVVILVNTQGPPQGFEGAHP